jgi:hypothetical protein
MYLLYLVNTPGLFDKYGNAISGASFVNRTTLDLNQEFYDSKASIHITTVFALDYMQDFIVFAAVFTHIGLWHGKEIWSRFRSSLKDIDAHDIHSKLMVSTFSIHRKLWPINM